MVTSTPIFELTGESTASIVGWAGQLISNVMPLLVIVLGIGIGLWILDHFLHR